MEETSLYFPSTIFRRSYELARSLNLRDQMRECADLLSNPQLLGDELLDACAAISSFDESELPSVCEIEASAPDEDSSELILEHFYRGQRLEIVGGPDFSCLATNVRPVAEGCPSQGDMKDGLDYIGLLDLADAPATPALGVVQSVDDTSAYALLLRILACLSELAPGTRFRQLNREHLKGALAEDARFEMHLVLWNEAPMSPDQTALCEFARDLVEVTRSGIERNGELSARVGTFRCLTMNPGDFYNRLDSIWQV